MTDATVIPTKRKYTKRQTPQREAEIRAEETTREPIREKKTRTRKGNRDQLYVAPEEIPAGMDYQWVTDSVNGQPTPQVRAGYEANGWEPVPADRHPGMFMPKGYKGEINVGGLVLMERPMELTMEARAEENLAARQAMGSLQSNLRAGNIDGVTLDTQHPTARANTRLTREVLRGIPVTKD